MDRNDNLNDNPVGIRDRLRNNPAPAAPQTPHEPTPEPAPHSAPVPPTVRQPEPEAQPPTVRRAADARRAISDLAARLARESAAMNAESRDFAERAKRLAELAALYQKQLEKLDDVTPEKCGAFFPKTVDNCRLEYFRLAGEAETLCRHDAAAPGGSAKTPPLTIRELRLALWIPAVATLLAGLIVAVTLAVVFH